MWFYYLTSLAALLVAVAMVLKGNFVGFWSLIFAGVLYWSKDPEPGVAINVLMTLGTHRWILLTLYVLNKFADRDAEKKA